MTAATAHTWKSGLLLVVIGASLILLLRSSLTESKQGKRTYALAVQGTGLRPRQVNRQGRSSTSLALPECVAGLRPVVRAGVWEALTTFFQAQQPPLRIHVIDLEELGLSKTYPCMDRYKRGQLDYVTKFAAELLIPMNVQRTSYVTTNPANADVFLVAFCIMGRGQQGRFVDVVMKLLEKHSVYQSFWQRKHGYDHAITLSSDHGPCKNFKEWPHRGFLKIPWITRAVVNVTKLVNDGSSLSGCYTPGQDIVIPTPSAVGQQPMAYLQPFEARRYLAFMAGKNSSEIRGKLWKLYYGDTDFTFGQNLPHDEYMSFMAASMFCLCVRGQAAWSPRLTEAISTGCIPVLVADLYDPPWNSVLDYSSFSVRIAEQDITKLKTILLNIKTNERRRLHNNVRRVQAVFRYEDPALPFEEQSGMTPFLVFQLWWTRRHAQSRER